jgi:proline iminopeptidase
MTPDGYTNSERNLTVSDGHRLYVHDWGNPKAELTCMFLHGGPGGNVQRVVFFDQRGSGKSTPHGSIKHNTTKDMIADIEAIVTELSLDKIILVGGSWGSCLALSYGLVHPERVHAMVLNGIFTGSKREINWIDQGLFQSFFPDVWQRYQATVPSSDKANPSAYHYERGLGNDPVLAKQSVYAYSKLEESVIKLDDRMSTDNFEDYDPAGGIVEMHYLHNLCFMPDRFILEHASNLQMPIWLIQGRYDMVCPTITAYELDQVLPHSTLIWTTSGHKPERESWNLIRSTLATLTSS